MIRPMIRIAATALSAAALALSPLAGVAGAAAASAQAAPAQAGKGACAGKLVLDILPGLSLEESSGSVYTRSGSVTCTGRVLGTEVTGPGTYSSAVRYGDPTPASCVKGAAGWGLQTFTFPTAGQPLVVRSLYSYSIGPVSSDGLYTGRFSGDYFSGIVSMLPAKGDCVTSPVTLASATFSGDFHAYSAPSAT
jgi:hypothetical protein